MRFSDKQYNAATFGTRKGTYFVLCGPVRSGKSASGLRGFLWWAGSHFSDSDFCLAAKSAKQWAAVIDSPMRQFCEGLNITLKRRSDHWEIQSGTRAPNRFWRVVGGTGGTSSERIEGMTFAGAYVDDACFHPKLLLDTICDRCSVAGAKVVFSCYPQGPFHPFKLDYIDKIEAGELSGEYIGFELADNPSLSAQYVKDLKARWSGIPHEYARRVMGQWASSSGLVYPGYEQYIVHRVDNDIESSIFQWDVASDWAASSVTHALLIGTDHEMNSWVWDEWRHDGRINGELATSRQAELMVSKLTEGGRRSIKNWIVDPSADGLMIALRDRVQGNVIGGVAKVDEGLRATARKLENGELRFRRRGCSALLAELGTYMWDEKYAQLGEDKPDKDSADGAHGADALRYYCHTFAEAQALRGSGYGVG